MVHVATPPVQKGTDSPAAPLAVSTWSGQAREQAVQRMFTAIACVYDLNNTLLSFGLHSPVEENHCLLCPRHHGRPGTRRRRRHSRSRAPDRTAHGSQRPGHCLRPEPRHAGRGAEESAQGGAWDKKITCLEANAEHLGFPDGTFHAVTTGFCMRNVGNLRQAVTEIHRILQPGGRFVCLEFSRPVFGWLRATV